MPNAVGTKRSGHCCIQGSQTYHLELTHLYRHLHTQNEFLGSLESHLMIQPLVRLLPLTLVKFPPHIQYYDYPMNVLCRIQQLLQRLIITTLPICSGYSWCYINGAFVSCILTVVFKHYTGWMICFCSKCCCLTIKHIDALSTLIV